MNKTIYVLLVLLGFVLGACDFTSPYKAANSPVDSPDLPNYIAADYPLPAGTFIIPMDNTYQIYNPTATTASSTVLFNLRSYGLVNALRKSKVPVAWIIKNDKAKDGVDISVACTGYKPNFIASFPNVTRNFVGGPFVVAPQFETQLLAVLASLSNSGWAVAIYKTTVPTTVNIRHILDHKIFIGLSSIGNAEATHSVIFDNAGFTQGTDWAYADDTQILGVGAPNSCYTTITEPHFDTDNSVAYTTPVRAYLTAGGNMMAQCLAIGVYESANFLTTAGVIAASDGNLHQYPNPSVPFGQFQGNLNNNLIGSIEVFRINPQGKILNDGFRVAQSSYDPNILQAMSGRISDVTERTGGVMFYLGRHDYTSTSPIEIINGARMLLNAVTSPVRRSSSCSTAPYIAELTITLTESNDAALLNAQYSYTATVEASACAGSASSTVIRLTYPSSLSLQTASLPVGCTEASGAVNCNRNTISPGTTSSVTIAFIPTVPGIVTVNATVTTADPEYYTNNNLATQQTLITAARYTATISNQFAVSAKTAVAPNQIVDYLITVTNTGAVDITALDVFIKQINGVVLSASPQRGIYNLVSNIWSVPIIVAGRTVTLAVKAQVGSTVTPGTQVTNTACIVGSGQAFVGTPPCSTVTSTVSKLYVTKTASTSLATVNNIITYVITVRNTDTIPYTITITDLVPIQLTFVLDSLYRFSSFTYNDRFSVAGASGQPYSSIWPGAQYTDLSDTSNVGFASGSIFVTGTGTGNTVPTDLASRSLYISGDLRSASLAFTIPSDALLPTFSFYYKPVSTNTEFNVALSLDCAGVDKYIFYTSTIAAGAVGTFVQIGPYSIPNYYIGVPACILFQSTSSSSAANLDEITINWFRPTIQITGSPSSIASGTALSAGSVAYYTYKATVNTNGNTVESTSNLVTVSASNLPNVLETKADVNLYPFPISIKKQGSVTLAVDGQSITYSITATNTDTVTRTISVSDVLPSGIDYTANSLLASRTIASTTSFSEQFTLDPSTMVVSTVYASGSLGSFVKINDATAWNTGVVTLGITNGNRFLSIRDTSGTTNYGFLVGPVNFATPNVRSATLSMDYFRNGPGVGLTFYYLENGSTGNYQVLSGNILSALAADTVSSTYSVSLDALIKSKLQAVYLAFFLGKTGTATNNYIFLDNISVKFVYDTTSAISANPPPSILTSVVLNPGDLVTITFNARVNNPQTARLVNTATATDTSNSQVFSSSHTLQITNAIDDIVTTVSLASTTISVLDNDIGDVDADTLSLRTSTTKGTLTLNNLSGIFTYAPAQYGTDSFIYSVCNIYNGALCSTATVYISNKARPIANPDFETVETRATIAIRVVENDTDPDVEALTVTGYTTPSHGVVTQSGNILTYDPTNGYVGTDTFQYTITDASSFTASATVTINVIFTNNNPVANPDSFSTPEDTPTTLNVLQNDSDVDPGQTLSTVVPASISLDSLTIINGSSLISFNPNSNAFGTTTFTYTHGSVIVNNLGTLTYTPNLNFFGNDTFQYTHRTSKCFINCNQCICNR